MADEDDCNTGLSLGLGIGQYATVLAARQKRLKDNKPTACLDLTFTLCPKEEKAATAISADVVDRDEERKKLVIGSSLKTRGQDGEARNRSWESNNHNSSSRKKLRLTKEQSNLLEDSFKLHTTLNSSQKQSLAEQLNLKPRQVEVWFQNRRARTKLKQTEVDCEFLKKRCESLTDENKRLKKELQELQSIKAAAAAAGASPLFIQLQKASNCCPSCEKIMRKSNSEGKTAAVIDVVLKNNKWQSGFHATK